MLKLDHPCQIITLECSIVSLHLYICKCSFFRGRILCFNKIMSESIMCIHQKSSGYVSMLSWDVKTETNLPSLITNEANVIVLLYIKKLSHHSDVMAISDTPIMNNRVTSHRKNQHFCTGFSRLEHFMG